MKEKVLGDLVVCIISDKQRTHRSGDQWKILRPFNVGARAGVSQGSIITTCCLRYWWWVDLKPELL